MRIAINSLYSRRIELPRPRRVLWSGLWVLLLTLSSVLCARAQDTPGSQGEPEPLDFKECGNVLKSLSKPPATEARQSSRIKPGEMQCYRVNIAPNQFIHVEVTQRGVDVLVQLFRLSDKGGQPVKGPIDNPYWRGGIEPLSELSDPTAETTFVIGVKSQDDETATDPQYEISVTEVRDIKPGDEDYIAAERAMIRGRLQLNDARTAFANGQSADAQQLGQKAAANLEKARRLLSGGSSPIQKEVLNSLGVAYGLLGRNDLAIPVLLEMRTLLRNAQNVNGEAVALINLGKAYSSVGDQEKAGASFEEASETLKGVSPAIRAAAWDARTDWLVRSGNILKAVEAGQNAANLYSEAGQPDQVAATYTYMGILSFDRGALGLASDYYKKALESGTSNVMELGKAKYNLAVALQQMGEPQLALDALRDAEKYYAEARLHANAQNKTEIELATSHVLKTLGIALSTLGDDAAANGLYLQALALSEPEGKVRFLDAAAYVHLYKGFSLYRTGNTQEAEAETRKAFTLFDKLEDDRGKANALANVGVSYLRAGNRARALDLLKRAAALEEGKDLYGLGYTKTNIGAAYIESGQIDEAISILNEALTLRRTVGDKSGEITTLYYLGLAESRRQNLAEGLKHLKAAGDIIEGVSASIVDRDLRAGYRSSVHKIYELEIHLLAKQGNMVAALEVADNARARALSEALIAGRVELFGGLRPEARARMQQIGDALSVLVGRRKLLRPGAQDSQAAQSLDREINSLQAELHSLNAERLRSVPVSAFLVKPERLSAEQIKGQLGADTTLLEFSLGDEGSYLWLVTGGPQGTVRAFSLPDRRKIEEVATPLRKLLGDKSAAHEKEVERLSGRLSEMLLTPIANELDVKRLAIVADGILQYIPFGVLPTPGQRDGRPLVVGHEVVNLPSVSSLAALRLSRTTRARGQRTLAVFANPVYEFSGAQGAAGKKPQKGADSPGQLAFSNQELSAIEDAFKKSRFANGMMRWTNYDANRLNAVGGETRSGLADFIIIHYSTHGVADDSRPEASGLYLSRYDRSGKKIPDFVGLRDVYNLNLSADLVVLSACETALGKDVRGEGLIGLTYGFINSGAAAVVASLWEVDEYHTSRLMGGFYRRLLVDEIPPSEALRATQEEMWRAKLPRYLWAGFILEGEWVWRRPPAPSR